MGIKVIYIKVYAGMGPIIIEKAPGCNIKQGLL
jgi:hypothetical protein